MEGIVLTELISKERILERVAELAELINNEYANRVLTLICVLKGAFMFGSDLAKHITLDMEMEFIDISSYGNEMRSSGIIKIEKDLDHPVTGKNILIVEDIVESGRTLSALKRHLYAQKPDSLKICTFMNKPGNLVVDDVVPDYVGFEIPDVFVVGYGLDYKQRYRNLPYISAITFE